MTATSLLRPGALDGRAIVAAGAERVDTLVVDAARETLAR